jgi:hypothetical protein
MRLESSRFDSFVRIRSKTAITFCLSAEGITAKFLWPPEYGTPQNKTLSKPNSGKSILALRAKALTKLPAIINKSTEYVLKVAQATAAL